MTWIDISRVLGAIATWGMILVWWFIGRDLNKRVTRAEDQIGIVAKWLLDHKFDEHPVGRIFCAEGDCVQGARCKRCLVHLAPDCLSSRKAEP